ncbi:ABC transporter transmembrane domain-containing protein [Coxiella burnetii]|uniref:ABC transporter transmembrane domain-containing protein n=1 Tax=Coxiella burnetii TaxID=777 RepID=UPI0021763616|nr:ABC transporter transmembrane domain-containing protein [Coxiella burnetii]
MKEVESLYKNYFKELTPFLFCLVPLLEALQWNGTPRDIIQAFPHFTARLGLVQFLRMMNILGFEYKQIETSLDKLNQQFLPCLFVVDKKSPYVLLRRENNKYIVYNGKTQAEEKLSANVKGTIFSFYRLTKYEYEIQQRKSVSLVQFFKKFRFQLIQLLIISLLSAALSLAIPLYILIVYDRVVRALSSSMLFSFGGGVLIALIGIALLEKLRSNLMTYIGNQLDASTGREILDKVLSLPMTYLEQSPVGSQIARIKDMTHCEVSLLEIC